MPMACELFVQWRRARGGRSEPSVRPFSRNWEDLLETAELVSAVDRGDAERDARHLAQEGWVTLGFVRYKSQLIERIAIPLEAEARWCSAFGFTPVSDEETRAVREYPWCTDLAFVREARLALSFDELRQIDRFLSRKDFSEAGSVPVKERSLELFGDEKRLDILLQSALFREGRLTLEHLRCHYVIEPLGWKRGPNGTGPSIVLENAATWDTYTRWNESHPTFSATIYGQGNCFAERVLFLTEIFRELGGPRPVYYFGDLDAAGLRIPSRASKIALRHGLPPVEPHLPSYRALLTFAAQATSANDDDPAREQDFDWLGPMRVEAWQLLGSARRLAQEYLGWDYMQQSGGRTLG
jgi:hypothetical protein